MIFWEPKVAKNWNPSVCTVCQTNYFWKPTISTKIHSVEEEEETEIILLFSVILFSVFIVIQVSLFSKIAFLKMDKKHFFGVTWVTMKILVICTKCIVT